MKKVTNTAKKDQTASWLMGGNPSAIEAQEARGQQELVTSSQLPVKCNTPRNANAAEIYEKMGIKVFTPSEGDGLFLDVNLPEGWKKEATNHPLWNNLVDNNGAVRAMFFYKAAFYDRDAFISFNTRYDRENEYAEKKDADGTYPRLCKVVDRKTKQVLFKTEMGGYDDFEKQYKDCEQYLNEHFPEWEDIHAYWND